MFEMVRKKLQLLFVNEEFHCEFCLFKMWFL